MFSPAIDKRNPCAERLGEYEITGARMEGRFLEKYMKVEAGHYRWDLTRLSAEVNVGFQVWCWAFGLQPSFAGFRSPPVERLNNWKLYFKQNQNDSPPPRGNHGHKEPSVVHRTWLWHSALKETTWHDGHRWWPPLIDNWNSTVEPKATHTCTQRHHFAIKLIPTRTETHRRLVNFKIIFLFHHS